MFKEFLTDIEEIKERLILLGIILGGYFQVIGLWSVGLGYIRFFSGTQIISDGILGTLILMLSYGLYEQGKQFKYFPITLFISSILLSLLSYYFHWYYANLFLIFTTLIPIANFVRWIYIKVISSSRKRTININENWRGFIYGLLFSILLLVIGFIGAQMNISSLAGLSIRVDVISELEKLGTGSKIQYFNDKYTFIVNDLGAMRKVRVLKTDDILFK